MKNLLVPSLLCVLSALSLPLCAADLPAGTAKGTFTAEGKTAVTLAYAAAFVDQKDDRKPTVLILSDAKIPTEKWTSEFDLMRAHPKFSGAVFFIDKEGVVYRSDVYDAGRQSSVSGYFTLKLNGAMGKDFSGTVKPDNADSKGPKLEAVFHATVK